MPEPMSVLRPAAAQEGISSFIPQTQKSRCSITRLLRTFLFSRVAHHVADLERWSNRVLHESIFERIKKWPHEAQEAQKGNSLFRIKSFVENRDGA